MNFTLCASWNIFIADRPGTPHVSIITSGEAVSVPLSPCIPVAVNSEQHSSEKSVKGQKWRSGHCHGAQVTPGIHRAILSGAGAGFIRGVTQTWVVFHLLAVCMSRKAQTGPLWSSRQVYPTVQPITRAWAARQV